MEEINIQLDKFEFPHMHIQVRKRDFVMKVFGKVPVVAKTEREIVQVLKQWAKQVRQKNWGK